MDTTKTGTTLEALNEQLANTTFNYDEVALTSNVELVMGDDKVPTISFDGETYHVFSTEGIVYLGYRLGMGGTWLNRMVSHNPDFARRTLIETIVMDKWSEASVMLAKTDDVVYGVLSKYTPMFHSTLVNGIAEVLSGCLASWTLGPTSLKLRLSKNAEWLPGQVKFGITVENGTAGTVAFGFSYSIFTAQGNEFIRGKGGRTRERHILPSDLEKVETKLAEAVEEATMEAFASWLLNHNFGTELILEACKYGEGEDEKTLAGKIVASKINAFSVKHEGKATGSEWLEFAVDNMNDRIINRFYDALYAKFEADIELKASKAKAEKKAA